MSRYDAWRGRTLGEVENEIRTVQARLKRKVTPDGESRVDHIYLAFLKTLAAKKRREGEKP